MNIYLDIETVPANAPEIVESIVHPIDDEYANALQNVKAPGNYKDAEKISEFIINRKIEIAEAHTIQRAKAIADMSFNGATCRICCAGIAVEDEPPQMIFGEVERPTQETILIVNVFSAMKRAVAESHGRIVMVGHNITDFDLRILWQRAVILGIHPPRGIPWHAKPWDTSIGDTMQMWNPKQRTSLDKLCRALGIESPKEQMDGSQVWPAYQAGEHARIAAYCAIDVNQMRKAYKRMTFES